MKKTDTKYRALGLRLPVEAMNLLEAHAIEQRRSMGAIARMALELYFKQVVGTRLPE